jgi:hypothetical protein
MIEVKPLVEKFSVCLEHEETKLELIFNQLDYFSKNFIATKCTRYEKGKLVQDLGLNCFYNLKYGLKELKGFAGPDGKEYKLEFETEEKKALTDKCINELMACKVQTQILYIANNLDGAVPEEILDPVTGKAIEGIEIVLPKGGLEKK